MCHLSNLLAGAGGALALACLFGAIRPEANFPVAVLAVVLSTTAAVLSYLNWRASRSPV